MANTDKKSLWGFLFYIPYIRTRYKLYPHSLIHTSLNNAIPVTFTTLDNGQDIEWQIRREKINSFLFLFLCTYIRPHYDIFNHSLIQSLWTMLHLLHLHDRTENGTGDKIENTGETPPLYCWLLGVGVEWGEGGTGGESSEVGMGHNGTGTQRICDSIGLDVPGCSHWNSWMAVARASDGKKTSAWSSA